jgi:hypothetical protein
MSNQFITLKLVTNHAIVPTRRIFSVRPVGEGDIPIYDNSSYVFEYEGYVYDGSGKGCKKNSKSIEYSEFSAAQAAYQEDYKKRQLARHKNVKCVIYLEQEGCKVTPTLVENSFEDLEFVLAASAE